MRSFLFLVLLALFLNSCDNTLKTNAPFKEIMVVYGALNKNDSQQVIRVQRAFLNAEQNAFELAQVTDSNYFRNITVELKDNNGNSWVFNQSKAFPKDTGIFVQEGHVVYVSAVPLRTDRQYFLTVTNNETGTKGTGSSMVVDDAASNIPSLLLRELTFDSTRNFIIRWTTGNRGRVYDATLRFFYEEYDVATNNFLGLKSVDWNIVKNNLIENPNVPNVVNYQRPGQVFFDFIGGAIKPNPDIYRKAINMTFFIWGGDDEMFTYIDVNRPPTGLVQRLPQYSNIGGGHLGIFASRNRVTLDKVTLASVTQEQLRTNSATWQLNFR